MLIGSTEVMRPTHARIGLLAGLLLLLPSLAQAVPLSVLHDNPRWLTLEGVNATYLTGISGGENCNAAFCGIQDLLHPDFINLTTAQTFIDTFDGTSTDLGPSWDAGYGSYLRLDQVNGQVRPSETGNNSAETYNGTLNDDQYATVRFARFTGAGVAKVELTLNYAKPATDSGYICSAFRNFSHTASIEKFVAGIPTTLASENTTTWARNDLLQCEKVGNKIFLKRNGVQLLTATDDRYRGGRTGLTLYATTAVTDVVVDNFSTGNIVADVTAGLDAVVKSGLNFVRLWTMEQSAFADRSTFVANGHIRIPLDQFPWILSATRVDTSTGASIVVGVYDLAVHNQVFFDRVRARVLAAIARGITPSVMLFSGGHLSYDGMVSGFSHPFFAGNNLQSVSADLNTDGQVEEVRTLANTRIRDYQRVYVRKMVDTLNDIDVVIFEISNEDKADTTDWHNDMVDTLLAYEATGWRQQHLVWISAYDSVNIYSGARANNDYLFSNSRPHIISPSCTYSGDDYDTNPPASSGQKVVFYDSDHTGYNDSCGTEERAWPWKLFTRGIYPVFLSERETPTVQTEIKAAMAQTREYANKMPLAGMVPETARSIFSSGYGLSKSCSAYLMYVPSEGSSTIDLSACSSTSMFLVEFMNPVTGAITISRAVSGGASRTFNLPWTGEAVVYLSDAPTGSTGP